MSEAKEGESIYDLSMRLEHEYMELQRTGEVYVDGEARPWEVNRQAKIKYYLQPQAFPNLVLQEYRAFVAEITTSTGKHNHQGGCALYFLEGNGYSIIDGIRLEWEPGDVLLMPLKDEGVTHQHFSAVPGQMCRWLGIYFMPYYDYSCGEMTQIEDSPDYRNINEGS